MKGTKIISMFPSRFIVLILTFRFNFESIFIYIMCSRFPSPKFFVCLFFFAYLYPIIPAPFIKKPILYPLTCLGLFVCWKFVNSNGMVYFWLLNLFHWSIHPILSSLLHCLDYYPSSVSLKSDGQSFPNFYFTFMLSHLIPWNENACLIHRWVNKEVT